MFHFQESAAFRLMGVQRGFLRSLPKNAKFVVPFTQKRSLLIGLADLCSFTNMRADLLRWRNLFLRTGLADYLSIDVRSCRSREDCETASRNGIGQGSRTCYGSLASYFYFSISDLELLFVNAAATQRCCL